MTEQQMDGGSASGTSTNVNGGASGNQSDQQPSFDAARLQSSLDALISKVETLESRTNGLQSVKDKTTEEVKGLKAQIAEYEKLKEKLGPEGALDQMELKQTLAEIKAQLSGSVSTQAIDKSASGAVDAAKLFEEMGHDLKDPLVSTVLAGLQGKDKDAIELAGYRLKNKLSSTPSPTQAQGAAITGTPPSQGSVDEKTQQYKNDMLANKGNPQKLREIKQRALQEGVPVHSISF